MARVVLNPGALAGVITGVTELQDHVLGPAIVADMVRYAPERTGELKAGIRHYMEGTTLVVVSEAPYSAWVELGHRVFHPSTGVVGPEVVPEEPFMRPALYKYRTPEMLDPPALFPVAVGHPGGPTYPHLIEYEVAHLGWIPESGFVI